MNSEERKDLKEQMNIDKSVIAAFHQMWDLFPGSVRLIHKNHTILASNPIAKELGFEEGLKCICIEARESHRNCKSIRMLKTQTAQVDRPSMEKVRGWIPVVGYDDIYVHFTLTI